MGRANANHASTVTPIITQDSNVLLDNATQLTPIHEFIFFYELHVAMPPGIIIVTQSKCRGKNQDTDHLISCCRVQ